MWAVGWVGARAGRPRAHADGPDPARPPASPPNPPTHLHPTPLRSLWWCSVIRILAFPWQVQRSRLVGVTRGGMRVRVVLQTRGISAVGEVGGGSAQHRQHTLSRFTGFVGFWRSMTRRRRRDYFFGWRGIAEALNLLEHGRDACRILDRSVAPAPSTMAPHAPEAENRRVFRSWCTVQRPNFRTNAAGLVGHGGDRGDARTYV